jgi:MFS family permease
LNRREFLAIFVTNMAVIWVCAGLLPLLPIYAGQLGASPAAIGNYLALAFLGTALGTVAASWLVAWLRRRRILILVAGLISAPATWLMGQASTFWELALWTTVVWTLAGVTLSLVNVIAGLATAPAQRGKVFGMLALASALGSLLGSAMSGPIVDRWGFEMLLSVMALFWLVQVGGGYLLQERPVVVKRAEQAATPASYPVPAVWPLLLLLVANFLLSTVRFVGGMGQTLAMDGQGFPMTAVTLIAALGAAFGLILNPLAGRLSDRFGRRSVLVVTYVSAGVALAMMSTAVSITQFAVIAFFLTIAYAADAVTPALITDLVAKEHLDRWMSIITTARWVGAIVGYSGTGYAVQYFGLTITFLASALIPLLAVILLIQARQARAEEAPPTVLVATNPVTVAGD